MEGNCESRLQEIVKELKQLNQSQSGAYGPHQHPSLKLDPCTSKTTEGPYDHATEKWKRAMLPHNHHTSLREQEALCKKFAENGSDLLTTQSFVASLFVVLVYTSFFALVAVAGADQYHKTLYTSTLFLLGLSGILLVFVMLFNLKAQRLYARMEAGYKYPGLVCGLIVKDLAFIAGMGLLSGASITGAWLAMSKWASIVFTIVAGVTSFILGLFALTGIFPSSRVECLLRCLLLDGGPVRWGRPGDVPGRPARSHAQAEQPADDIGSYEAYPE